MRRPGEYGASEGSGAQARTPRPHSDRPADRRHPMAAPGANGRLHSTGASGASHALHAQAHSGHGLATRSPRPRTAQSGLNARRLALDVLTDVREGEISLSNLWFRLQELKHTDEPLPAHLDFRMH